MSRQAATDSAAEAVRVTVNSPLIRCLSLARYFPYRIWDPLTNMMLAA